MVLSHCYEAEVVVVVAAAVDDDGPTSPHAVASYDLFPLWRAYHLEIGLPDGLSAVEQFACFVPFSKKNPEFRHRLTR